MPSITLTSDQKAQLIGWAKRERHHLIAIVSISERILVPRVTQSTSVAQADLDFIYNLIDAVYTGNRNETETIELPSSVAETLADIANLKDHYSDKAAFWRSIAEAIEE